MSPTFYDQYEKVWSRIGSDGVEIYQELSKELLDEIDAEQVRTGKTLLMICDDITQKFKHLDQETVDNFVSRSRHRKISMVFLFQRVVQCPPCIRANIDVIIAFGAVAFPELDALHNMASVTNRKQFKKMFYQITNENIIFW